MMWIIYQESRRDSSSTDCTPNTDTALIHAWNESAKGKMQQKQHTPAIEMGKEHNQNVPCGLEMLVVPVDLNRENKQEVGRE